MLNDGIGMTPVLQEPRRKPAKKPEKKPEKKLYFLAHDEFLREEYYGYQRLGYGFIGNGTKESPLVHVNTLRDFASALSEVVDDSGPLYNAALYLETTLLKTLDSNKVSYPLILGRGISAPFVDIPLIEVDSVYYTSLATYVGPNKDIISYDLSGQSFATLREHANRFVSSLNGAEVTSKALLDFIVNDPLLAKRIDATNIPSVTQYPLAYEGETAYIDGKEVPILSIPESISDFVGSGFTKDQFVKWVNTNMVG